MDNSLTANGRLRPIVIGGDTDSIFIIFPNCSTPALAMEWAQKAAEWINAKFFQKPMSVRYFDDETSIVATHILFYHRRYLRRSISQRCKSYTSFLFVSCPLISYSVIGISHQNDMVDCIGANQTSQIKCRNPEAKMAKCKYAILMFIRFAISLLMCLYPGSH